MLLKIFTGGIQMEMTRFMRLLNEAEGSFYRRNRERTNFIKVIDEKADEVTLELGSDSKKEKVRYRLNAGKIEREEILLDENER